MCKILAKTKDMTREEWLTLRKQGIGGSDAGAVCGLNPYVSPMDVYMDKSTEVIPEQDRDNEATALIKTYFPKASDQTIILSTDSEIDEKYYKMMKPSIGDEFTLEYSDVDKKTSIRTGYFDWGGKKK